MTVIAFLGGGLLLTVALFFLIASVLTLLGVLFTDISASKDSSSVPPNVLPVPAWVLGIGSLIFYLIALVEFLFPTDLRPSSRSIWGKAIAPIYDRFGSLGLLVLYLALGSICAAGVALIWRVQRASEGEGTSARRKVPALTESGSKASLRKGWAVLMHSLQMFARHPRFLVPMLLVWLIYAPTVIYLKYFFPWHDYSLSAKVAVVFLVIVVFSFFILVSCAVMLEMIRQLEWGQDLSLFAAVGHVLKEDLLRLSPLALTWAAIWFVLSVVEAFTARRQQSSTNEVNAQEVAATLANYDGFSWRQLLFGGLEKGVRMIAFLILPGIVWEQLNFRSAIKKSFLILKTEISAFAAGYGLTYAASGLIFLPPVIVLELGRGRNGHPAMILFPDWVWIAVIIYIGLAWSFCMYLEQVFMANIYYWHMNWKKTAAEAMAKGQRVPHFAQVPLPTLLDFPDLKTVEPGKIKSAAN